MCVCVVCVELYLLMTMLNFFFLNQSPCSSTCDTLNSQRWRNRKWFSRTSQGNTSIIVVGFLLLGLNILQKKKKKRSKGHDGTGEQRLQQCWDQVTPLTSSSSSSSSAARFVPPSRSSSSSSSSSSSPAAGKGRLFVFRLWQEVTTLPHKQTSTHHPRRLPRPLRPHRLPPHHLCQARRSHRSPRK